MVHPSGLGSLVDVGPQSLIKPLERGSVRDVASPTTHHQLEERGRAERGSIEEDLGGKYSRVTVRLKQVHSGIKHYLMKKKEDGSF